MIHLNDKNTTELVVRETPDLMAKVETLDAALQSILDRLTEMNDRLEKENIELAQRLGLPRPEVTKL